MDQPAKTPVASEAATGPQTDASPPAQAPPEGSAATSDHHDPRCRSYSDPHRHLTGCRDDLFHADETLARGWQGVRDALAQRGIIPSLSYFGVLQTNATGGSHNAWVYAGQLTAGLDLNLQKLIGARGTSVYASFTWGTGGNLSSFLNSSIPVNGLYAPSYYLEELYLHKTFFEKTLKLAAGRIGPSNSFAKLPVFSDYTNYGVNPNPISLGKNDYSFFGPPPSTQWGAQATYSINQSIQVATGMFNTNLNSANGNRHGTDFALQEGNKGALVLAEVDYFHDQGASDKGKPGAYVIGFVHDNNSFAALPDRNFKSDTYSGFYVLGQQMIYRPRGTDKEQGMTAWAAWTYNSNQLISPMPSYWGGGLSYEGLFPSRKRDTISTAWIYGKVSDFIPATTAEKFLEVNYQWRHSGYLSFMPQFQYIWRPSGHAVPGAAVAGIQVGLTF